MYIQVKDDSPGVRASMGNGKHGLFTTMSGGVPIETRVIPGKGFIDKNKSSHNPIDYKNSDMSFEIHTGYDNLILSFANEDIHISVKTGSSKDLIGAEGWRHIAHKIALDLTGETCIPDAPDKHVRDNHWKQFSKAVVGHIHKLVDISSDMVQGNQIENEAPAISM